MPIIAFPLTDKQRSFLRLFLSTVLKSELVEIIRDFNLCLLLLGLSPFSILSPLQVRQVEGKVRI